MRRTTWAQRAVRPPFSPSRIAYPLTWILLLSALCALEKVGLTQQPVEPVSFRHAGVVQAWETYRHRLTFGKGQTLALVDDGCDLAKPEWSQSAGDQPKVLVTYDSVDGDDNPRHEGKGYHGTTIGIPSSVYHGGKWGVAYNNQVAVIRALECCHGHVRDGATVARALQWIIDHHQEYRITTVNLAPVDDLAHAQPVATDIDDRLAELRQLGIWVSAPSGNHNFTDGISWPACQPNCFAIGAVRPGRDEVYLDRHEKVDLVVPAAATSSSNAIACGAAIVLREAIEETGYHWRQHGDNLAVALLEIMQRTGVPAKDAQTGRSYRRLDLAAALGHVFAESPRPAGIRFSEHLIADKYAYAYGIAAVDFDRDGDLDVSSADYTPHNRLYLFENDGLGNFRQHHIQRDDPERLERHMAGDVDGDGDLDVVIVKNLHGHLLWFENSGQPTDGKLWARHVITTDLPGAYDVALGDFDQDGDLDVAGSSWVLGNQFAWFRNDGAPGDSPWEKLLIEDNIPETRTMRAADFDGDGDLDLLGTARKVNRTVWYENQREAQAIAWRKHVIDSRSPCPTHGNPVDMDGDGDLDVVMALGFYYRPGSRDATASERRADNQIVWYENDGQPARGPWRKHVVGPEFDDAFEAVASDLDGDGDVDIAATSWRNPGRVAWFENQGDPRGRWDRHLLKNNWRSANQVLIADLNGDGRPDILACAEHGSYELRWWRNEGLATPK
ncbi:MAG: FG-GAP-like repeat-containing protein [Pirellulaceae bacterium]